MIAETIYRNYDSSTRSDMTDQDVRYIEIDGIRWIEMINLC